MPTSYTETFDLSRDCISLLALPCELDTQLDDALHGDDGHIVAAELEQAITAKIQEHGVDTETGEWFGEWSAEQIVRGILTRHPVEVA